MRSIGCGLQVHVYRRQVLHGAIHVHLHWLTVVFIAVDDAVNFASIIIFKKTFLCGPLHAVHSRDLRSNVEMSPSSHLCTKIDTQSGTCYGPSKGTCYSGFQMSTFLSGHLRNGRLTLEELPSDSDFFIRQSALED
jgi:hypothetical protein